MPQANGSQNGFLASSDWTTFNGKQNVTPNLTSLDSLAYSSASFVKMTGVNTFTLDTNTYATTALLSNYLPLSGGTLTGSLTLGGYGLGFLGLAIEEWDSQTFQFSNNSGDKALLEIQAGAISTLIFPDTNGTLLINVSTSSGSLTTTTSGSVTIPDASASVVGLVNTGSQTFAGSKVFNSGLTSVSNIRGMTAIFVQPSGGNTLTELTYSGTPGSTGSGIMRLHKESGGYAVATKLDANGSSYFNGGNVGIGTTTPNASAILELNSTTQGFLPPRMTQAQRIAIISPATGLMVYQTDSTEGVYVYDSTNTWRRLNWT
jgi:hypothetical protein